jgi:hypothetical protein
MRWGGSAMAGGGRRWPAEDGQSSLELAFAETHEDGPRLIRLLQHRQRPAEQGQRAADQGESAERGHSGGRAREEVGLQVMELAASLILEASRPTSASRLSQRRNDCLRSVRRKHRKRERKEVMKEV